MTVASSYPYAVARVRALETRLVNRAQVERMVEASGAAEALQVLGETEYSEALTQIAGVHAYEELLATELQRVYRLVRGFYPDSRLVDLFAARYDAHNLKVLLKAHFLGEEPEEGTLLEGVGTLSLERLRPLVAEGDFRDLPRHLREAAQEIWDLFAQTHDPQQVDLLLDGAVHRQVLELAGGNAFLQGYLAHWADLINIRTFLRVRRLQRGADFLERALLPGGRMDRDLFTAYLDEPLEVFTDRMQTSPYARVLAEGSREWLERATLTRYEKLADEFLLEYLKQGGRYSVFGPEPLVAYLAAKENELKLIRIIMVGKINQLPTGAIKERIRDVFI